jgi:hypothetical protein
LGHETFVHGEALPINKTIKKMLVKVNINGKNTLYRDIQRLIQMGDEDPSVLAIMGMKNI